MESNESTMNDVPMNMIIETDLGDILVQEARTDVHRCTNCVGLKNASICHFLICKANSRADGKNVIVVPYNEG